eukprot:2020752-Prymnesium_polylepis.1
MEQVSELIYKLRSAGLVPKHGEPILNRVALQCIGGTKLASSLRTKLASSLVDGRRTSLGEERGAYSARRPSTSDDGPHTGVEIDADRLFSRWMATWGSWDELQEPIRAHPSTMWGLPSRS